MPRATLVLIRGRSHYRDCVNASAPVEVAEQRYQGAEEAFLAGVRGGVDAVSLGRLAKDVAERAADWNSIAYDALRAATSTEDRLQLDRLTERTEVLLACGLTSSGPSKGCQRCGTAERRILPPPGGTRDHAALRRTRDSAARGASGPHRRCVPVTDPLTG